MKNVIRIVSVVVTAIAFVLLNSLMWQVDFFQANQSEVAPVMLVVVISLFAAFVVILVVVVLRLRKMK